MLVTNKASQFTADAVMPDGSFKQLSLSDYAGKKVVLFFYPLDFTFVWPSELIAFDHRIDEFEKRNTQVLGCSVDSQFSHLKWREMDINSGGIGPVKYPLIADLDKSISRSYDVLLGSQAAIVETEDENIESTTIKGKVSLRATFLIDEEGSIRHSTINDLPLGRNIDEMLRLVDALDHHNKHGEVCPAGWRKGDVSMTPSNEGMVSYLQNNADKL